MWTVLLVQLLRYAFPVSPCGAAAAVKSPSIPKIFSIPRLYRKAIHQRGRQVPHRNMNQTSHHLLAVLRLLMLCFCWCSSQSSSLKFEVERERTELGYLLSESVEAKRIRICRRVSKTTGYRKLMYKIHMRKPYGIAVHCVGYDMYCSVTCGW